MFRHRGRSRSFIQNLGIASLLSFVAGIVNVVGFLSVKQLTTNVTGHFAFLVEEALKINFQQAFYYFLYIFFFFSGAFFSNFIIEFKHKYRRKNIFIIPILTEALILLAVVLSGQSFIVKNPNLIACTLLFSMGLQNSLVTTISNSLVRTTHLTGLFTDLGIEFSQLLFFRTSEKRKMLLSSIKLRLTIIASFFLGGIFAGTLYSTLKVKTLLIASIALIFGIFIDYCWVKRKLKRIKESKNALK